MQWYVKHWYLYSIPLNLSTRFSCSVFYLHIFLGFLLQHWGNRIFMIHWQQIWVKNKIPPNLQYKSHLCGVSNCWSLRCSWSIACRRCSNYIFIFDLTTGFSRLGKDKCKTRRETFNFWELVRLILEIWRYTKPKQSANRVYILRKYIELSFAIWLYGLSE